MEAFLESAIRLAVPILFLALGELVIERSGVLNLGIEGLLVVGALMAALGAESGGSTVGVLTAMGAGIAFTMLVGFLVVTLHIDQIVAGLALNIGALGFTTYLFRSSFDDGQNFGRIDRISVPGIGDVPFLRLFINQSPLFFVLIAACVAVAWLLYRSKLGLRIRAAGDAPAAVDAQGISIAATRYLALLVGGVLGGLAGAYLVLVETGKFTENASGGRGFIAIAAVVFGGWRVLGVIGAAAIIGIGTAAQFELPALGVDVPTQFLIALPYIVALVAIVVLPQRGATPKALMKPFIRGER